MLVKSDAKSTRDLLNGKNGRDKTHFRMSQGAAWTDWLLFIPLFAAGGAGVLLGYARRCALFGVAGACSLYVPVVLWFTGKGYVYPSRSPLRYFTY